MPANQYVLYRLNDRTYVMRDGSIMETVWNGATVQAGTGEKGALMPPYASRSQMEMVREHAKYFDPGTPFDGPSEADLAKLNDEIAEALGWKADAESGSVQQ